MRLLVGGHEQPTLVPEKGGLFVMYGLKTSLPI